MNILLLYIVAVTGFLPIQDGSPRQHNDLIGQVYKQVYEIKQLKSFKQEEGILIDEAIKDRIGFARISNGNTTMVLCTKYVEPRSSKILAVLDIGKLQKNTQVIMAKCRVNARADGYIVAVVKPTSGKYFKQVIQAWRMDMKSNRFVSIPTKGLDCINEEYGNIQ